MTENHPTLGVLDDHCPLRMMFDLVGDRWTSIVLFVIGSEVKRYSDLHRQIPGVSKKMLTQTLRNLQRNGLVVRKVYPVVPPKTEYRLTPLGVSILDPIQRLADWAVAHQSELRGIYTGKPSVPDGISAADDLVGESMSSTRNPTSVMES
ncbi:winged helix-turn-helix transcriptional regulator [Tuwongella immobilis]|uniref:HTH hxlR-type domain-containing protein n=1 Tax=Tuwongella immobilis TaxID=692036 RepID=A0A6C2YPW2_9BACT|nr:helix-turn-helix domain-containing protein [Tuwongella immobilis]VIP03506.1 HxlR family transcriptional regulator OS=Calothrix sp. 336/3 GN=IJ00_04340 PE=4 SV=1: HxlR [Tuwongella immobilis]VTS04380.1 HxlR family transcriptional regulator OS=Calothrix sp. 336/3 GN=IJ00_04340 PE=4 SV=1: HxlR [Tuwongella immobilis]